MKNFRGIAAAMTALMASGAFAATATLAQNTAKKATATKKVTAANKNKATAKKAPAKSSPQARSKMSSKDSITPTASSALLAANAPPSSTMGMTAGTSMTEPPKAFKRPSALDKMKLGVLFEYYGSSVADPLSGKQTDKAAGYGQSADPVELWTTLNVGYMLSSNLTLSANVNFQSITDTEDKTPGSYDPGSPFRFRSDRSYLKLGVGKFLEVGKFKWNGDFRLYGTQIDDRTENRLFYYRGAQNFIYSVNSRLTAAVYNTLRFYKWSDRYLTDRDADNKDKLAHPHLMDFRATVGPALEYQTTDAVILSFSYNMDFARDLRTGMIDVTSNTVNSADYGAFFEVGSSIDINKNVNLNPYFDFYTATPNMDAAQIGINLALTVL